MIKCINCNETLSLAPTADLSGELCPHCGLPVAEISNAMRCPKPAMADTPMRASTVSTASTVSPREGRFVAFDIETARLLPDDVDDLKAFRPLGIACAALLEEGKSQPHLWYSTDSSGRPAAQMCQRDLRELVNFIQELTASGARIVTWNGLGFDFDILAEESGLHDECKAIALDHVDMMFHVFCEKGFAVSLEAASQGLKVKGKLAHIDSAQVPHLWASGQRDEVLAYVANDCRITLDVARKCSKSRSFRWVTKRGSPSSFPLFDGWLRVSHALKLPLPDTSWMDNPWPRTRFLDWTLV